MGRIDYDHIKNLLDQRSKNYIKSGANEGERNTEMYHTAQQCHWNHIPIEVSMEWFLSVGESCGLKPSEIIATVKSAYKTIGSPIHRISRYLASSGSYIPTLQETDSNDLPPATGTFREFAVAAWKPGERIFISAADAPYQPREFSIDEAVDLIESGRFPILSFSGLYCSFNPITGGHRRDSGVTDLRHVIIEWDSIPLNEQWSKVETAGIPVSAAIFSGSKSIHFWVRVDAPNIEEYNERIKILTALFPDCDRKLLHPGAWTRLPGALRQTTTQEIIKLSFGAPSWDEWMNRSEEEDADKVIDVANWLEIKEEEPDEIIEGVLHKGCKMILGGSSKSRKSWSLLDMAISIASGTEWMGFQCKKAKVVFINMEIHKAFLQKRIRDIVQAKNLVPSDVKNTLYCIHRRGRPIDAIELAKLIHKKVTRLRGVTAVIIDPIYKTLNGLDENKAGDIGVLMNTFDSMAYIDDISVVFAAHFAKGNSAERESIDRVSGSGVFARDPDSFMTMTRLQEPRTKRGQKKAAPIKNIENIFQVDCHLRHHVPIESMNVVWNYPIFSRMEEEEEIDLSDYIPVVGDEDEMGQGTVVFQDIHKASLPPIAMSMLNLLNNMPLSLADWKAKSMEIGVKKTAFNKHKSELILSDLVSMKISGGFEFYSVKGDTIGD